MPITHQWDNPEKTIYRIDFDGAWTWQDLITTMDAVNAAINAAQLPADKRVDSLLCFNSPLPPGDALRHLRGAGEKQHPKIYRTVFVNPSEFLVRMVGAIDRSKRWEGPAMVKTVDEARALLASED